MPVFILTVTDERGVPWEERYDKPVSDPEAWAKDTIEAFNKSSRGAPPRQLLGVNVLEDAGLNHEWEKSNLVTVIRGKGMYDTVRCTICGATGKRYGLGNAPRVDAKYKKRKCRPKK